MSTLQNFKVTKRSSANAGASGPVKKQRFHGDLTVSDSDQSDSDLDGVKINKRTLADAAAFKRAKKQPRIFGSRGSLDLDQRDTDLEEVESDAFEFEDEIADSGEEDFNEDEVDICGGGRGWVLNPEHNIFEAEEADTIGIPYDSPIKKVCDSFDIRFHYCNVVPADSWSGACRDSSKALEAFRRAVGRGGYRNLSQ